MPRCKKRPGVVLRPVIVANYPMILHESAITVFRMTAAVSNLNVSARVEGV